MACNYGNYYEKTIKGKTYNTDTVELIGEWDNISTNVGKTLASWGAIHWRLHLRSSCRGFVSFQCFRTIKNKELFLVIRSGWEERVSKIEIGLSPQEWEMRLQFLENSFLDQNITITLKPPSTKSG